MKRHDQVPGVRKWAGEDFLDLQAEGFKVLDQFFGQYGDMVISGCEVDAEAGTIAAGIVGLTGKDHNGKDTYKVCPFAGAADIDVFPVYLALKYTTVSREYADTASRPIAYQYEAELLRVKPEGKPFITLSGEAIIRFTDAIEDDAHRFVSTLQKNKIGNIDLLMAMLPTSIDRDPTELDNAPWVGKLVYTTDEEGERTFWRCYDNTPGACVWHKSDGGGLEAVYEKANITIISNQQSPDVNLLNSKIEIAYVDVIKEYTWKGQTITIPIPPGVNYQVIPKGVNGYKVPDPKSSSSIMANSRDIILEYLAERITINVSIEEGGEFTDQKIRIVDTDTEDVIFEAPVGENIIVLVPYGTNGKIVCDPLASYKQPDDIIFQAGQVNRVFNLYYEEIKYGVFIVASDKTLYTAEEWPTSGKTAVGIGILSQQTRFVMSLDTVGFNGLRPTNIDIPNLPTLTYSEAINDFDGKANTDKYIAAYTGTDRDGAAHVCKDYSYVTIEAGQWYLPSLGQLYLVIQNKAIIQNMLSALGKTLYSSSYMFSSSKNVNIVAWGVRFSDDKITNVSRSGSTYFYAVFDY